MDGNFVDVWHGSLALESQKRADLRAVLSQAEICRAGSFKLPMLGDRYIAVRGLLRQTLARYLKTEPASLQFETNVHGKPFLACGSLHFNLSHTADALLIAVADFPDIGIDIEICKPREGLENLAARCFSGFELQAWQQLPCEQQRETFYRLWTKKEAFVKAVGRGIALGLEQCELELESGGGFRAIPELYGQAADWRVSELSLPPPVYAALVTRNCAFSLRFLSL